MDPASVTCGSGWVLAQPAVRYVAGSSLPSPVAGTRGPRRTEDLEDLRPVARDEGPLQREISVFDERDGGTFFGFSDPDGNTWAVQQLKARASKPLIPK